MEDEDEGTLGSSNRSSWGPPPPLLVLCAEILIVRNIFAIECCFRLQFQLKRKGSKKEKNNVSLGTYMYAGNGEMLCFFFFSL